MEKYDAHTEDQAPCIRLMERANAAIEMDYATLTVFVPDTGEFKRILAEAELLHSADKQVEILIQRMQSVVACMDHEFAKADWGMYVTVRSGRKSPSEQRSPEKAPPHSSIPVTQTDMRNRVKEILPAPPADPADQPDAAAKAHYRKPKNTSKQNEKRSTRKKNKNGSDTAYNLQSDDTSLYATMLRIKSWGINPLREKIELEGLKLICEKIEAKGESRMAKRLETKADYIEKIIRKFSMDPRVMITLQTIVRYRSTISVSDDESDDVEEMDDDTEKAD